MRKTKPHSQEHCFPIHFSTVIFPEQLKLATHQSFQNKHLEKPELYGLFHLRTSCSRGLWHEAGKVVYLLMA